MKLLPFALLIAAASVLSGCSSPATPSATTPQTNATGSTGTATPEAKKSFSDIVLTDDESTKTAKSEFGKDTPKIWAFFGLDVPNGSKVQGTWICEKSAITEPNYKIDEAALTIGPGVNTGNFSLSKPTKGWPEGEYRVELSVDGKVEETVKFTIK